VTGGAIVGFNAAASGKARYDTRTRARNES
jgi:hypothetical protein